MKWHFDYEFMRHAMLVVAGHRFWILPFATLLWLVFKYVTAVSYTHLTLPTTPYV